MRGILIAIIAISASAIDPSAFFEQHCTDCHGPDKQKGKLRLDSLPTDSERWLDIADQLALGEMPPEDEQQPRDSERSAMVAIAEAQAEQMAKPRQVVLRRLNRAQYRNTIRDLLQIDTFAEDPTEAFPADDKHHGFDNLGETLQMSDFLLRQYLKVARLTVDRASFEGEQPPVHTYTLRENPTRRALHFKTSGNDPARDYLVLSRNDERAPGDPRGQSITNCREGALHAGWYTLKLVAESRGRGKLAERYSQQRRKDYPVYRPEDLHRLEVYLTAPSGATAVQTRVRRLVHAQDLPDNQRLPIELRLWLPEGWRIELGWGNGYWGVVDPILLVDPDFDFKAFRELPKREQNSSYGKLLLDRLEPLDAPRIIIHEVEESGPHFEQWPPASQQIVSGDIRAFAERAFRRPVSDTEIQPFLALAETHPRRAIEAILCSPRFLYLDEPAGPLDDYALASRLSYFLWNSMPDAPLLAAAKAGKLRDSAEIAKQLTRMLADSRSDEFVSTFVWAWLRLENTVEMAPDPTKFYDYHRHRVDEAMIEETTRFFRHLLAENLPIATFLDADFSIVNAELVRHYALDTAVNTTAEFQRVSLPADSPRGGLLGQAAVLTASANGVDTSPVVRGIWILENLLGTPPAPPPPDVDIPEPDARGDLTIRELYAKHRTIASCNDCHKRIDPLGFALENFDAVGNWRDRYENDHPVDPSGQMPTGEAFANSAGLKAIMTRDLRLFSRNLSTKLITYATGRSMGPADRAEIARITTELDAKGGGLKDLLGLVVTSKIFHSK